MLIEVGVQPSACAAVWDRPRQQASRKLRRSTRKRSQQLDITATSKLTIDGLVLWNRTETSVCAGGSGCIGVRGGEATGGGAGLTGNQQHETKLMAEYRRFEKLV